jgi:sec-independent protein translocase protein TatC
MRPKDPDEFRMSIGDHLDELRRRLLLGLIGPVGGAILALIFGKTILALILQPGRVALARYNLSPELYSFGPVEPFAIYLKISLIGGIVLGLPWLVFQFWKFVAPGLYPREQRMVLLLAPGSVLLTATGLAFMYMVMLPVTLAFLIQFSLSFPAPDVGDSAWFNWVYDQLTVVSPAPGSGSAAGNGEVQASATGEAGGVRLPVLRRDPETAADGMVWLKMPERQIRVMVNGEARVLAMSDTSLMAPLLNVSEYVSFVLLLALAFAISFQLPLVMLLLGTTGLVTPAQARQYRKYALLACFVVAAFLTPQDPFSMILLAVPLYGLYEVGMVLMRWSSRGRQTRGRTSESPGDTEGR